MSYPSAPPRVRQIDVVDTVGRAYRAVIDNAQLVAEMALLPFLVIVLIELAERLLLGANVGLAMGDFVAGGFSGLGLTVVVALLVPIAVSLVFSIFIVRWYRFLLLGESVAGGPIPPGWNVFIVAALKLAVLFAAAWIVLTIVALLPPHIITAPLATVGMIAVAFLSLRFALIFPAAAIERPIDLRTAWNSIEGNYWRLLLCIIACYLPFFVIEYFILKLGGIFPSFLWIVFEAARLAVSFAAVAVTAALLSHLYSDTAA